MGIQRILIVTFLAIPLVFGCKKEDTLKYDYLIFGRYGGWNSYVDMFKIENGVLYEDTGGTFPYYTPFQGSYAPLPASKLALVADLGNHIPDQLFNEPDGAIGMPNAADQGGYFVQIQIEGTVQYWHIDTYSPYADNPHYLANFLQLIHNRIEDIQ